jgi:hypothetical protein
MDKVGENARRAADLHYWQAPSAGRIRGADRVICARVGRLMTLGRAECQQ